MIYEMIDIFTDWSIYSVLIGLSSRKCIRTLLCLKKFNKRFDFEKPQDGFPLSFVLFHQLPKVNWTVQPRRRIKTA